MSTHTATTLPSISNLLNGHPPTPPLPDKLQTPAFNLLPASPVASHPPSPPHSLVHSPQYNHLHLHPCPVISPLLSPVDSCSSRSSFCKSPVSVPSLSPHPSAHLSVPGLDELPPLQGYDPPVRRLSSNAPQIAPWSVKDMHLASLSQSHPQQKPSPPPPSSPTQQQQQLEKQKKQQQQQQQQQPAATTDTPSTQIIISPSGQPILKRRRGRPPNNREPQQEGGWTFLTPTVWDVKQTATTTISTTAALSGVSGSEEEGDDNRSCVSSNSRTVSENLHQCDMNGSMAAFTSSNMETVLQMPRKKRGRKPKRHIEGNSCFVWKDMPASRSSSKRTKKP